jgi:oligoendopeptidase F
MSVAEALPRWDMTVIYPDLDSAEFQQGFQSTVDEIAKLAQLFDELHIEDPAVQADGGAAVDTFESVFTRYSDVIDRARTLDVYIEAFVATDSRNDLAQARLSELERHLVVLSQLGTRLTAWIGSLNIDLLIERSSVARDHAFLLRKFKTRAEHLMTQAEEILASEMDLTGGSAWSKLHDNMASQLLVPIEVDGRQEELPIAVVRNMAYDRDRDVRRRAYEAELVAWERISVPLAAALNSIKGQSNTLNDHRHWDSALDLALFNNNVDRQSLDAMLEAARASFPDLRRYLRTKAKALGVQELAWYDLFAPLGESSRAWGYDEATGFLLEQFGSYSSRLRGFAERAFEERWIDAEPREGKVGGAFCMRLRGDESRILANFVPSYDGMSTLAHELGHGYHNFNLAKRPTMLRTAPMTLAETASTFCETIVRQAALQRVDAKEQLSILEVSIQGDCQVVVDITSRFLFEQSLLERRRNRELSVEELNELMLEAQRETYGDGLDQRALHPYMWAVKGHYYSAGYPFYNFPYMFGLLFGLGLYARYQADPESFTSGYDQLLASTGEADAATLCARFGIDVRSPEFWHSSIDVIRQDVRRFEELVNGQ